MENSNKVKVLKSCRVKKKLNKLLFNAKKSERIVIHSVDDTSYPNNEENSKGKISSWFKVNFNDFYINGIELLLHNEYVIINDNGKWSRIKSKTEPDIEKIIDINKYKMIITHYIGRILYDDIVEIDDVGDDIEPGLHLYCRFDNNEMPYKEFVNQLIDNNVYLKAEDQDYTVWLVAE